MATTHTVRAPTFNKDEMEVLVNEVLHHHGSLLGGHDVLVKAHKRKEIWQQIAQKVRRVGFASRMHTQCHKRWNDIFRQSTKVAEMMLGLAPRTGRFARVKMTTLMYRILERLQPELHGRLRALQDAVVSLPDATGGEDTYASAEPHHEADTQHGTDTELGLAWEVNTSLLGDRQALALSTTSDCVGDCAALTGTWLAEDASCSNREHTAHTIQDAPPRDDIACMSGTATVSSHTSNIGAPSPAEYSLESAELLRQLCVGQTALMHAMMDQDKKLCQVLDLMSAIHSDICGLKGAVQWLTLNVADAIHTSMDDSAPLSPFSSIVLRTLLDESVDTTQTACPE